MPNKATTVRLEPSLQQGLETLSRVLKRPMNQLVNEALQDYVCRRSLEVAQELSMTLTALRAYRDRDPGFKTSIEAAAKGEVAHRQDDPVDAEVVIGELIDGRMVSDTGPVVAEIRQLQDG